VGKWVRRARSLGQLLVLIVVDPVLESQRLIQFEPSGGIRDTPYMDDYPFPFYLVLKNLRDMPAALGDALRQWFELMQHEE
jgi:midasin